MLVKVLITIQNEKNKNYLDLEVIKKNDPDYQQILKSREERKVNQNNFQDFDTINWN